MKKILIILTLVLFNIQSNANQKFGIQPKKQINLHLSKFGYRDQISNDNVRLTCYIASTGFIAASLLKKPDYTWVNSSDGVILGNNGQKGYWKKIPFYKDPGKIYPLLTGVLILSVSFAF